MDDDPPVAGLVARARIGDNDAWDQLVERYAPLLWSICGDYGLSHPDAADVCQRVWMYLVEQLPAIRRPEALPGWLVTTTRRECVRLLGAARRCSPLEDPLDAAGAGQAEGQEGTAVDRALLAAERDAALREAFQQLRPECRRLLALLIQDPPVPYAEISAKLGIPVGSIGPTRARCLSHLRRSPALAALIDGEPKPVGSGGDGRV
jgi:RNA polymerase sigma factor (sigma-70 family)